MRCQCLERGCIHDVWLRGSRRKTVLVISSPCSAHFFKRRRPLLLPFPIPSVPVTLSHVWWSVATLALKSPRRMSLSVRGVAEITESRSCVSYTSVVTAAAGYSPVCRLSDTVYTGIRMNIHGRRINGL